MLHRNAALPCSISMQRFYAALPCSTSMQNFHAALPCSISMQHFHAALPCSTSMLHYKRQFERLVLIQPNNSITSEARWGLFPPGCFSQLTQPIKQLFNKSALNTIISTATYFKRRQHPRFFCDHFVLNRLERVRQPIPTGNSNWGIPTGEFQLGNSNWGIPTGEFQLGNSRLSRSLDVFNWMDGESNMDYLLPLR